MVSGGARTVRPTTELEEVLILRHGVVTSADLHELGVGHRDRDRLVTGGVLQRVARGAFVDRARYAAADRAERHRLRAAALARVWPEGVALSHGTGAVMLDLPVARLPRRVHGSRLGRGQHRRTPDHVLHERYPVADAPSPVLVRGVPVLEPALCLLGLAQVQDRLDVVMAADAALHRGLTTTGRLEAVAARCRHRPGVRAFAAALPLMDPRCESPGESRCRLVLRALGLPVTSQVTIRDERGVFLGRVDFVIDGSRVVIEFDGMTKYADAGDLAAEKRRELRLQRAGWTVVRLVWGDLDRPERVRDLISAALARARG